MWWWISLRFSWSISPGVPGNFYAGYAWFAGFQMAVETWIKKCLVNKKKIALTWKG
jgi:hypothetical protein